MPANSKSARLDHRISGRAAVLMTCLLLASASRAVAQPTSTAPTAARGATAARTVERALGGGDGQTVDAAAPAKPEDAPATAKAPATPTAAKPALMPLLKDVKFQRTPAAVLQARADLALANRSKEAESKEPDEDGSSDDDGEKPVPDPDDATGDDPDAAETPATSQAVEAKRPTSLQPLVTRYRQLVMAGYWKAVHEFYVDEAGSEAGQLYTHLLRSLAQNDKALVPEELIAVAEAAPADLTDANVSALGRLLRVAIRRGSPDALTAILGAGTEQFGGDDPEKRARAADLLIEAGLIEPAYFFLAPLPEDGPRDPKLLGRHARYHEALGRKADSPGKRQASFERAWSLFQEALGAPNVKLVLQKKLVGWVFRLLPRMPEATGEAWKRSLFKGDSTLGMAALAHFGQAAATHLKSKRMPKQRAEALGAIRQVVDVLLDTAGDDLSRWRGHLDMLALSFLAESDVTRRYRPPRPNVRYSNPGRNAQPIPPRLIIPAVPDVRWIRAVDSSIAERLYSAAVVNMAKTGEADRGVEYVRAAHEDRAELGRQMAERFVSDWAESLNPNLRIGGPVPFGVAGLPTMRVTSGVTYYNNTYNYGQTMPLTRSRQVRSLRELARVLRLFGELGIESIDPAVLATTFTACHSSAEVYRRQDIEHLLGPIGEMAPEAGAALADKMRTNLASIWRNPKVQKASGTRRNDKQINAEVERGYVLAVALIESALGREPDSWRHAMSLANLSFDLAEFRHQQDPSLDQYAPMRNQAFDGYQKAAELYWQALVDKRIDRSADIFLQWFASALGASELGYLTRQTKPDNDQVEAIVQTLTEMPDDEARKHTGLFARGVDGKAARLKPQIKPRYLRHARRIIGDHPDGETTHRLTELYDDLVKEVQLAIEIDGPAEVGAEMPFGARISLRYTNAVKRETINLDKYLRNQVYHPATRAQVDYRDDFEKRIREALFETFEIEAVQFHVPEVADRGFGRPGWVEKPLAYMILAAKDPAVDRIPAVQIDMDFSDGSGTVILPVMSQVTLVDAGTSSPDPRPVNDIEVDLVLDDRELAAGIVKLEVRATGRGLVPGIEDILAKAGAVPGFTIANVDDHGLNMTEMDAESDPPMPLAERGWLVEYRPIAGDKSARQFRFPTARSDDIVLSYQRYADMDIVETAAVVDLDPWLLPGGRRWMYALGGLVLVGLVIVVVLVRRRSIHHDGDAEPLFVMPDVVTPLNAISLLRRMEATNGNLLDEGTRRQLSREVSALERHYFAPDQTVQEPKDLRVVLGAWLARVAQ